MSFTIATVAAVGIGLAKGISGYVKGRKAKKDQKDAQEKLDQKMKDYENLDTSNPYANLKNEMEGMENTFEDLTVNTQEAEFQRDSFEQQQSNMMGSMESSGTFTAGNIQALAGAGANNARQTAASIGSQESANQQASAAGAANVQDKTLGGRQQVGMMKAEGEAMSRQMEADKQATLLGLAQEGKSQADANKNAASEQMWSGISQTAGAFTYKEKQAKKASKKESFKPHMMYDPKSGKGFKANTMADHLKMKKKGYTHVKPKNKKS